jgi:hypothetical protein
MTSPPDKAGESPPGVTPPGFTITDRPSATEPAAGASAAPPLPPVEFATFVLSLGSSALMHLGEVERPGTGSMEKNLPMAKHSIDILSMLESKTKGNLSAAEAQLLENLLFDLRLRYVEATRK